MRLFYLNTFYILLYNNVFATNVDRCDENERRRLNQSETCKNGVYINDLYYEKVVLITCLQLVYFPNIDFEMNTLFYSNAGDHLSVSTDWTAHRTARLDLSTLKVEEIKGDNDAFSNTLDRNNRVIYSGTRHGIYAFNYANGTRYEYFGAKGVISDVQFVNGTLYYSSPTKQVDPDGLVRQTPVKLYSSRDFELVEELKDFAVQGFVIDNDGDITFYNSSGIIYTWKKQENKSYAYATPQHLKFGGKFTMDNYGHLYVCLDNGLYKIDKVKMTLELYIDGKFSGLTFDKDNNVVYSNLYSIVKLVPDEKCKKPEVKHEFSWDDFKYGI